jgi:hypothetical protein
MLDVRIFPLHVYVSCPWSTQVERLPNDTIRENNTHQSSVGDGTLVRGIQR